MTRHPFGKPALLALAALSLSSIAQAEELKASGPTMNVTGFGTVGVSRTNRDDAEFGVPGQPSGATRSASAKPDTKLGVQLASRFSDTFSATAQVLTKYNADGNWNPRTEWLFGKAQLTPTISVRLGRIGAPTFAVSDFREVNYANTWTRPPLDVYGQFPISHFDGADVIGQWSVADSTVSAQVFAGKASASWDREPIDLSRLRGFNLTAELEGGWTLRLGHAMSKLSLQTAGLPELLQILNATPFTDVARQLDANGRNASFSGAGIGYDNGSLLASAEYTRRRAETGIVADTTGWYGSIGYRLGKFTPYLVASRLKVDSSNLVNTIPKGVDPDLTALSSAVDSIAAATANGQRTQALGVRWDAVRNVAVKLQYERIRTVGGIGQLIAPQPGFGDGARIGVLTLSADFVF